MRAHSSSRAQGVIEYILAVTAVIVVLITMVLVKGGPFVKGVNSVLESPMALITSHNNAITFTEECIVTECLDNETSCGSNLLDNCGGYCGVGSNCPAGYSCKDTGNMSECILNQ
jgi:hypothetical protein